MFTSHLIIIPFHLYLYHYHYPQTLLAYSFSLSRNADLSAVQGLCGSGLQRGPLPVPQPVPGHRHQGDVPAHTGGAVYKYSNFQVSVFVCVGV